MHLIIQNLEIKIYVVYIFKRHTIKNLSDMFRIVCDPSSGSIELYLTEIRSGSLKFVVCLIGVLQRFLNQRCLFMVRRSEYYSALSSQTVVPSTHTTGSKLRFQTPIKRTKNISEPLRFSVKYSSILTDDGSPTIRNMS